MRHNTIILRLMKRIIFVFLVFYIGIAAFSSDVGAQEDKYSFRLRGMGEGLYGFIDDLYSDLSLNPSYIRRYKGNWIYTNLSNLQGGADAQAFDQHLSLIRSYNMYPNNLFGAISTVFGSPFGVFFESRGYNITSDNKNDAENYITSTTGVTSYTREALLTDGAAKNFTAAGLIRDIGVSFSFYSNALNCRSDNEGAVSSFQINGTTHLRENTSYVKNSDWRKLEFPNSLVGFSIGRVIKKNNSEFSIAVGRRAERMMFGENELLGVYKEQFLSGIGNEFSVPDEIGAQFIESGFRSIYVNTRLKKIYSSLDDLRQYSFLISMNRYSLPFDADVRQNTVFDSLAIAGGTRKKVTVTRDWESSVKGKSTIKRIEFGTGMERYFNNLNTMIALGAKLDYIWGDLAVTFHPSEINEILKVKVEVGDPAEEAASYGRVISDNKTVAFKSSIKGTFLNFPAGLETRVGSKFSLRFGTQYMFSLSSKTEWESQKTDLTDALLKTDETSTTFIPTDGFNDSIVKKVDSRIKKTNFNSYHFGANYAFNDKISVDFLHFSKLTELDTWWISIVIKN